jgi:hypothetical protein
MSVLGRLRVEEARGCLTDTRGFARGVVADVAANDDYLAVAQGAGVSCSSGRAVWWNGDFDPGEGGDGKDVHVGVLDLFSLKISQSTDLPHLNGKGEAIRKAADSALRTGKSES